jgi:hypothetical protein
MPITSRSPKVPHRFPLPKLCRHATKQAFCRVPEPLSEPDLRGRHVRYRNVYFGSWGSTEAIQRYSDFVRVYEANGHRAIDTALRTDTLLVEVACRYLEYLNENGSASSIDGAKQIAALIGGSLRTVLAAEFQPCHIRALQKVLIDRGNARSTIRDRMGRIRMMLKWAVSEMLIGPQVLELVKTVSLPNERSGVRTTEPRQPVADESFPPDCRTRLPSSPPQNVAPRKLLPRFSALARSLLCGTKYTNTRKRRF